MLNDNVDGSGSTFLPSGFKTTSLLIGVEGIGRGFELDLDGLNTFGFITS